MSRPCSGWRWSRLPIPIPPRRPPPKRPPYGPRPCKKAKRRRPKRRYRRQRKVGDADQVPNLNGWPWFAPGKGARNGDLSVPHDCTMWVNHHSVANARTCETRGSRGMRGGGGSRVRTSLHPRISLQTAICRVFGREKHRTGGGALGNSAPVQRLRLEFPRDSSREFAKACRVRAERLQGMRKFGRQLTIWVAS